MKSFINWCRRYISLMFLAIFAFVLYLLFFSENSYWRLLELNNQITELRTEIKSNRDTMEYYLEKNKKLDTDPAEMERIVREQYHMQREGEEVYVVEE